MKNILEYLTNRKKELVLIGEQYKTVCLNKTFKDDDLLEVRLRIDEINLAITFIQKEAIAISDPFDIVAEFRKIENGELK